MRHADMPDRVPHAMPRGAGWRATWCATCSRASTICRALSNRRACDAMARSAAHTMARSARPVPFGVVPGCLDRPFHQPRKPARARSAQADNSDRARSRMIQHTAPRRARMRRIATPMLTANECCAIDRSIRRSCRYGDPLLAALCQKPWPPALGRARADRAAQTLVTATVGYWRAKP